MVHESWNLHEKIPSIPPKTWVFKWNQEKISWNMGWYWNIARNIVFLMNTYQFYCKVTKKKKFVNALEKYVKLYIQ